MICTSNEYTIYDDEDETTWCTKVKWFDADSINIEQIQTDRRHSLLLDITEIPVLIKVLNLMQRNYNECNRK